VKKVLRLPALYPKQEAFIRDPARFTWIEAGTKSGKSLACAIWLVESLWKNPGSRGWVVAPIYRQAEIIWNRCAELIPKTEREILYKEMRIKFPNGSVLEGKSGEDQDALYGDEVHFAAIDEASRMAEGSFHAVRSVTTRTQGTIKIIGTPRGKGNWFYRGCVAAKRGENEEHSYHHLTSRTILSFRKVKLNRHTAFIRNNLEQPYLTTYYCFVLLALVHFWAAPFFFT
jgi:hypothetical protein